MNINWSALADTAAVSFGITVAVVATFALGVLGLSRREAATEAAGTASPATTGTLALAGATVCFAACAAAVAYGLTLIAA
ncbi:ABC-type phosphate transport system substrate-binding protein [Kitasatospora sp. MAA4]|uniref:hypothetical protein n=1 Tax=Kitasatospora sp. MAA4 TaxID=3035093 RepID=UPI002473F900|nr:hypothetical protein [Kitasatospora sp. MAA4]MDH6133039.1 ABC-type phosphate transport system substrate-binding protein [Kitasatospora sp. MAA4]